MLVLLCIYFPLSSAWLKNMNKFILWACLFPQAENMKSLHALCFLYVGATEWFKWCANSSKIQHHIGVELFKYDSKILSIIKQNHLSHCTIEKVLKFQYLKQLCEELRRKWEKKMRAMHSDGQTNLKELVGPVAAILHSSVCCSWQECGGQWDHLLHSIMKSSCIISFAVGGPRNIYLFQ